MKVAIASEDGVSVSQHFGRSACFVVFDVENGEVKGREVRDNTYTAHARGECEGHDHDHGESHHSHSSIVEALKDCEAVLCRGMGWRAAEDLAASGIKPYVLPEECTAESAISLLLEGKVVDGGSGFCRCHG